MFLPGNDEAPGGFRANVAMRATRSREMFSAAKTVAVAERVSVSSHLRNAHAFRYKKQRHSGSLRPALPASSRTFATSTVSASAVNNAFAEYKPRVS